ncbi:MAG: polysaccharide deacetylase family protein [Candidatus Omnitrophota bacterium]|nr:polysaccharide deacetylase family protein [Candidatus Omnitrophota bacterium]MBA3066166.1 polysaccharide deacetylase family protein [bacterium]MBU2529270.1 polysaccharide deacetylase family protein [bacterium]MBU3930241.1 polysaccharide deacetylase family protein [bacterium]MBU4122093.1 polysaccharide deacetylase family protein [bacterium]
MIYFLAAILALAFSARWNWWRKKTEGVSILMYHKIGTPPAGSKLKKLWVSGAKFDKQMSYLKRGGYEVVTFKDIAGGTVKDGRKKVIITFDDGYRNNYTEAFRILKKYGFRAVFYVVSSTIGKKNLWHDADVEEPLEMMAPEEIRKMASAGMEIGGHTVSHKNLDRIDDAEAEREISENKDDLEKLTGEKMLSFSYPYGGYNANVKKIAEIAGYRYAVVIKQGKNAFPFADNFALKRLLVRSEETIFDFYLNLSRGRNRL